MKFIKEYGLPIVGAIVICAGWLWGMATLVDHGVPRQAQSLVPASAASAPIPPPIPAPLPERRAAPATNVVRGESRTYTLPLGASDTDRDLSTFNALQRNCYEAARNNRDGEYPALQQMACTRYAQFAAEKGWNAGQLPAYGAPPIDASPATAPAVQTSQPELREGGECAGLIAEKERIDERMRHGYYEPEGTRLRMRLREIGTRLWELHCKLT